MCVSHLFICVLFANFIVVILAFLRLDILQVSLYRCVLCRQTFVCIDTKIIGCLSRYIKLVCLHIRIIPHAIHFFIEHVLYVCVHVCVLQPHDRICVSRLCAKLGLVK
ncbi:hypothetical protein HanRHA438_Chr17g0814691 [Helianthus annuus]|nr:hypothetical protein HanHA89_Chr17g0707921 [Helianthus annuus]KAJ0632569.1 hypothetical protein HanLR1_Chr17g0666561 [Helianthus annuus]KAJ0826473.1 hypothetical protein HanRHA438_Chr17g0814691 [Helianthus annuus]